MPRSTKHASRRPSPRPPHSTKHASRRPSPRPPHSTKHSSRRPSPRPPRSAEISSRQPSPRPPRSAEHESPRSPRPPRPAEHEAPWRPTKAQLAAAATQKLRDVIAPDLDVLFCGINPGLYSAAVGHHFARPGNRFWPTLFAAGFTPRLLSAFEDRELLSFGLGVTNLVARASATADELSTDELRAGARLLRRKVLRYQPRFLAIVGFTAYRTAFDQPKAVGGLQPEPIGETSVWVLPNPSGLNAHHQPAALRVLYEELRHAIRQRQG